MTGSLITPRYEHTATRLRDGQVLVGGGYGHDFLARSELSIRKRDSDEQRQSR